MKLLLSISLLICLVSLSLHSCSQTRTIKGLITDQRTNVPIPFAPVVVKNSKDGSTTDENGKFKLTTKDADVTLKVTYLGYKIEEVKLKRGVDTVHIVLEETTLDLPAVTVQSESIIKMDKISAAGSYSFDEAPGYFAYTPAESDLSRRAISSDANAKAGVLTAGEINDFSKWVLWKDIETTDLKEWETFWKIHPEKRYSVQVETENGMPVVDAHVQLLNERKEIFWASHTDNTGKAELWTNIFHEVKSNHLTIQVTYSGANYFLNDAKEFHDGINILKIPVACGAPNAVDIAFVVDATGSMQDEINYLKAELKNIIVKTKDSLAGKDLNLGCVFYRDHTDAYLTKQSDFASNIQTTIDFINENNADGGGDNPEAVDEALNVAINHLSWRSNATARMIFLVLDAPPHSDSSIKVQLHKLIMQAAEKGIRIIPVTCSGIDKSAEYLLRSFALATNGTYVFLTDDSGVGGTHIKPTTDKYDVELLNNILYRVIYNFSHTADCAPAAKTVIVDTLVVSNPILGNTPVDSSAVATIDTVQQTSNGNHSIDDPKFIQWKYYPNPTFGIVNVEVEGTIKEFFVTDLSGKIILRKEANKNDSFVIDLSNFAAGTYFITAEYSPDKRVSGKIVLVH